jgi:hypothetical protein
MTLELPTDFYRGIDLFNEQEYFECHEVLELVWRDQTGPERELTQGIIQLAVGLYHLSRDNSQGALKVMTAGMKRVGLSIDLDVDIDVKDLFWQSTEALTEIMQQKQPALIRIRRRSESS